MVFDPKPFGDHSPVVINNQHIAQVDSYRYLGIYIDNKLTWSVHVKNVCTRVQQRLYFLHRLRVFGVNAVIESIVLYGISAWFGNLSVLLKAQITRLTQRAMKIMKIESCSIPHFRLFLTKQRHKVISDPAHVLHPEDQLLPSTLQSLSVAQPL